MRALCTGNKTTNDANEFPRKFCRVVQQINEEGEDERNSRSNMEKPNDTNRVFDSGESLDDFSREILVVCPKCESCALIVPINSEDTNLFAARRLTCLKCAYFREWRGKTIRHGSRDNPATDGFFGEVLWLQTACGNELLWACNLKHLTFIENYVRAKLRERRRRLESGWLPTGLSNRLPKWIGAAHNRETVLKAVQKIKDKFAESNG